MYIKNKVISNIRCLFSTIFLKEKVFDIERLNLGVGRKYRTSHIWCYRKDNYAITMTSLEQLTLKKLIIIYIELKKYEKIKRYNN